MRGAIVIFLMSAAGAEVEQGATARSARVGSAAPADTVVFVCEHGSVKSVVAAEWFNRMARERGLGLRAVPRGVTPDASVPLVIADALRRDGFEVGGLAPRRLDAADLAGALRIVAMGLDPAALSADGVSVERWDGIPPASESYAAARDAIRKRIETLLAALQAQGPAR